MSYCTNIHAGESLADIINSLDDFIPQIRKHLQDSQWLDAATPFGLGLRLSAQAAESLLDPATLQAFATRLQAMNAYVFTINAFPWGDFHQKPVKQAVYQPDWQSQQRLTYTMHCAQVLARLLPEGVVGSISTVPLGFAEEGRDALGVAHKDGWSLRHAAITNTLPQLRQAVVQLWKLHRQTGKEIVLALEAEPACLLENGADTLRFFQHYWLAGENLDQLARLANCSPQQAQQIAQVYLGVCLDVCHSAVEFEDPGIVLMQLRDAGIRIAKIQLSCALQVEAMHPLAAQQLQAFDDGVYLHQVVRRSKAHGVQRQLDLPQALSLPAAVSEGETWRVHCHVPLFWRQTQAGEDADDAGLASTWDSLRQVLHLLREQALSPHLEVETYTWDVLPPTLRAIPKATAIARELQTVLQELQP